MLGRKNSVSMSRLSVQIPKDAFGNWTLFIKECENALVVWRAIGGKDARKKEWSKLYEAILAHRSVPVEIPTSEYNDGIQLSMIDPDDPKRKTPLSSLVSDEPAGELTVVYDCHGLINKFNKNGDEVPYRDKEAYLVHFAQLLHDLGHDDLTRFGFESDVAYEYNEQGEKMAVKPTKKPVKQEKAAEETDEAEGYDEYTFGEIYNLFAYPTSITPEQRAAGEVNLLMFLQGLSKDDRDSYIGRLHNFVDQTNEYLKTVTTAARDLDGMEKQSQDDRIALVEMMRRNKFTEAEIEAVLARMSDADEEQQAAPKQDAEDEPLLVQTQRKPEELVLVNAEKYYNVLIGNANINQDDIPEKLKTLADVQAQVPFSTIADLLKDANLRYVSGPDKGKPVKFTAPKSRK